MAWDRKTNHRKLTGRPWRRLREQILQRDKYLCQPCMRAGRYTEATEVDHIVGIAKGGPDDEDNLQSICFDCHQTKTACESGEGQTHPQWLPKPACPVVLVTGPPGAGKTTYCKAKAGRLDTIIDLDECFERVCGIHGHTAPREHLGSALRLRNMMLADLAGKHEGRAYVIVAAPTQDDVDWWTLRLSSEHVRLDPGQQEAERRIHPKRKHLVAAWYAARDEGKTKARLNRMERRQVEGSNWKR